MLNIGNKNFMNLQEAVGWLLENNAIPFQSTANYAGNTEIAMSTLINPSPAKVRVGSIIFFADSKVSTVIGVTSNSFICSNEYNDLVDDVVYVTNVAINASGHLICTLSNGNTIDAGLIKQVASFNINGSQHLIATYNDGSTNDLGAIFSGSITISGNLTVTGDISGSNIVETMTGYSASVDSAIENIYTSACKNGNKVTFVMFVAYTPVANVPANSTILVGDFNIPASVGAKLYPYTSGSFTTTLSQKESKLYSSDATGVACTHLLTKVNNNQVRTRVINQDQLIAGTKYLTRIETTFLLSDPLI